MRNQYIAYIIAEFKKAYPHASESRLKECMHTASEDELYRVVNAIERFGIEILKEEF